MFNYILLYNSSKTYLQFIHFPDKFEFLFKSKIAAILVAILDDVTDPQQRYNPLYLPYLVDRITDYLLEVNFFPNIVTPQKPR